MTTHDALLDVAADPRPHGPGPMHHREARADALRLPPSTLARNCIRVGLTRTDARADEPLDRLEAGLAEPRTLLGR